MPPKAKRNNANQHDKRHESGLAAPGKRISKQKSNSNLNGQANGKAGSSSVPPPPLPSTGLNQGLVFPRPANPNNPAETIAAATAGGGGGGGGSGSGSGGGESPSAAAAAAATAAASATASASASANATGEEYQNQNHIQNRNHACAGSGAGVEEKGRSSSTVSTEDDTSTMASNQADEQPTAQPTRVSRRVSEALAYKTSITSSASSTLALAATILSSCPLRDAIAILILLLSLPPTLIITIHTLFASLTFVPPATANLSWNTFTSFPPVGDWFHATAAGGPSIFTMLTADAVMTLTYLCSPLFAQNVYVDLCQAVIAISLSGATAGKGGPANSVAFCSIIVFFTHFLRYNKIHVTGLDYFRSMLHNLGVPITWSPTPASTYSPSSPAVYGWPRTLLGCHILAQGLLTLLRRTLQSYSSHQRANANRRHDAEAILFGDSSSSGGGGGARHSVSAGDGNADPIGTLSTDGRPPGPSPALREGEKRLSSNKRKRKQANQVRSQQPLWAAIGSTKVTFLKEMEQKQASRDAAEADTANTPKSKDGSKEDFDVDRFWIMELKPTEILFRADLPSWYSSKDASTIKVDPATPISAGIDRTKPFYVRMNGADWGSTKINGAGASGDADDAMTTAATATATATAKVWTGEIYGLTPLTKYSCEFVCLSTQEVICSTSVVTLPAPSAEQGKTNKPRPRPSLAGHRFETPNHPLTFLLQPRSCRPLRNRKRFGPCRQSRRSSSPLQQPKSSATMPGTSSSAPARTTRTRPRTCARKSNS